MSRSASLAIFVAYLLVGCDGGKRVDCYLGGKSMSFATGWHRPVTCVCAGSTTLHCVDTYCQGSWCVPLDPDANPRAGDYRLTTSDIAIALAFCTYDTGGDPGLETIAEFGYFEPLDCRDR